MDELESELFTALGESEEFSVKELREGLWAKVKQALRARVIHDSVRADGRSPSDIRPIEVAVDLSPRAHGSGMFRRGATQVLTLATLGTPRERQELDILAPVEEKRYMHHYNFPPFSTGETKPLRGASRRDIGHGALAERALLPVLPPQDDFPYTMPSRRCFPQRIPSWRQVRLTLAAGSGAIKAPGRHRHGPGQGRGPTRGAD
jgi:polyribonucleotide nucleotidyltransferase